MPFAVHSVSRATAAAGRRAAVSLGRLSRTATVSRQSPQRSASRLYTTATTTTTIPPPPPRRRFVPRTASLVFFLLGALVVAGPASRTARLLLDRDGSEVFLQEEDAASETLDGDSLPELPLATLLARGSPAEQALQARLRAAADAALPVVAALDADPAWERWGVGERWEAESKTESKMALSPPTSSTTSSPTTRYTTGALGGLRGMSGYHRVFRHRASGEVVSVVFLGPALSGWPQTAHGGALATLLDEALGRCAIAALPAQTGVTARLELQYRRPVPVPGFYVVRCRPDGFGGAGAGAGAGAAAPEPDPDRRKLWCSATLESADGKTTHVEARGLFVVPKKYALARVEDKF